MASAYTKTCRACLLESGATIMFPLVDQLADSYAECTAIKVNTILRSRTTLRLYNCPISLTCRFVRTTRGPFCSAMSAATSACGS